MKKNAIVTLFAMAFVASSFAATTTTLKKTGKVFFRPPANEEPADYYYSPNCEAGLSYDKSATSSKRVPLDYNKDTKWFEIAVKEALPGSDTAFCIYSKADSSVSVRVSALDFAGFENLYIDNRIKYFPASDVKVPAVFVKIPDRWGSYFQVNTGVKINKGPDDEWVEIPRRSVLPYTVVETFDTISFKDTTKTNTYSQSTHETCVSLFNEFGDDESILAAFDCEYIADVKDTVLIDTIYDGDLGVYTYSYILSLSVKTPVVKVVGTDTLVSASLRDITEPYQDTTYRTSNYSKYELDNGYVNMSSVVDTVSIDSSDYEKYGDENDIVYYLKIRTVITRNKVVDRKYDPTLLFIDSKHTAYIGATEYDRNILSGRTEYFRIMDFEGDSVYIMENPEQPHVTLVTNGKPAIKTLHVNLPFNEDWFSASPMISFDGGKSGKLMYRDEELCGWFNAYFISEDISSKKGMFYSATDTSLHQGLTPGSNKTFALKDLFAKNDEIYLDAVTGKYSAKAPENDESKCMVTLTGIVYDTDVSLNKFFSVYTDHTYEEVDYSTGETNEFTEACVGIHRGIVQDTLDKNGKPILKKGSSAAKTCFDNDEDAFNSLFNYTKGVNEGSCYDFMLTRNLDSRWGYSSDFAYTTSTIGGFYPVEDSTGKKVFTDPLPAARTKRLADGPTIPDSLPKGITSLEKVCNGPGWKDGIDCEGLFVSDDPEGVVWNWTFAPNDEMRWVGEYHNQHFCFESHATFTYRKGQSFSVVGDDDIWVFVAGKLAVDNGGAHLAAPGYVDLSLITDKKGKKLVEGKDYDFDLFFCDRRTTMSNMTIATNIYLSQIERAELLDPCEVQDRKSFFADSAFARTDTGSSDDDDDDDNDDGEGIASALTVSANFVVMPYGRTLQIARATAGAKYTVFDMQGNMVRSGTLGEGVTNVQIPAAGSYLVKIGARTKLFTIK